MRALFRAFSAGRVRYLVINGQASILYGAAHFTQDLDLWIDPTPANVNRFLRALAVLDAKVHKLTPPLTIPLLRRGHGFHFIVPQAGGPLYLDIMGRPPRVGSFAPALRRAEIMQTPWGRLPVVSIKDLVELKKTNRPADYDIITRLALIRIGAEANPSTALLKWTLGNVFRVEELWELVRRFGPRLSDGLLRSFQRRWAAGEEPTQREFSSVARSLAARALRFQAAGRAYWLPILGELRRLRQEGALLREGTPVAGLIKR